MKKLIISADDFGMHSSINEAVEKGFQEGVLTSASIVANGPRFEEAVRIAKRNPKLGIGLHFNIIEGESSAGQNKVPSLVNEMNMFSDDHNILALKIISGKTRASEIGLELNAQLDYCIKSGLKITHIDSHRHLHILPKVYTTIVQASNDYKIKKFRCVNPLLSEFSLKLKFKTVLGIFLKCNYKFYKKDTVTPDYFVGFFNSGNLKYNYLHKVLNKIKSGIIEIGFHPGLDNIQLRKSFSNWNKYYDYTFDWEGDYGTITNPMFRQYIEENNIILENFDSL